MKFNLNKYLLEDLKNKNQPSEFIETDAYDVLVLRLPYIKDEKVDIVSYGFFIQDKIYMFEDKIDDFKEIGEFNELHHFLDKIIDKILIKVSKLHIEIANMEDDLYDGNYSNMNRWLILKKELGIIERLISHTILTYERFIRKYNDNLDSFAFNDLKEHLERVFRLSKSGNEKLDYLHSFYRGEVDKKMNNVMFVLTILSAIFMPLTLVTGFFGMNTGGLPFVNDNEGTLKVIILTLFFEIPFIWLIYRMIKFKK